MLTIKEEERPSQAAPLVVDPAGSFFVFLVIYNVSG